MDNKLKPLRHGITYLDNRASNELEDYSKNFDSMEQYFSITGNRLALSTCSMSNLLWIKNNESDNWLRTKHVGMLNSYIAAQLTGKVACDWTQASYSGVFSIHRPKLWNPDLIHLLGIPESILPEIVSPCEKLGRLTESASIMTGLPQGIPIAVGSGDTAAAAIGVGLKKTDTAFESVGTSGVLTFLLDKPKFDPIFMNRCHVVPGQWLAHGAVSLMGGSIDWLLKNIFTDIGSYGELEQLAILAQPGANGVVFLPYLSGERCPIWDHQAVGNWYGLTLYSQKQDLIESVYESGAFALRQILDYARLKLDYRINSVIAVGEGIKSNHWNQIKSDVLNVEYRPTDYSDATAYGAALMGGIAAGVYSSISDPELPVLNVSKDVYNQRDINTLEALNSSYDKFCKLYPALRDIMHSQKDKNIIETDTL